MVFFSSNFTFCREISVEYSHKTIIRDTLHLTARRNDCWEMERSLKVLEFRVSSQSLQAMPLIVVIVFCSIKTTVRNWFKKDGFYPTAWSIQRGRVGRCLPSISQGAPTPCLPPPTTPVHESCLPLPSLRFSPFTFCLSF